MGRHFSYFWCPRLAKECAWRHDGLHVLRVLQHMSCAACRPVKPVPPGVRHIRSWPFHPVWHLSSCRRGRCAVRLWYLCHVTCSVQDSCRCPIPPTLCVVEDRVVCVPPSPALHECRHCGFVSYRGFPCCQSWQPPGLGYLQCWPSWAQATWQQA